MEVEKEIPTKRSRARFASSRKNITVDLSAEPSFNVHVKLDRYIAKLNEYGKQGWRLISGTDDWKYSIFEREIEDKEE